MSQYFKTINQQSINPEGIARVGAAWGNVMQKAGSVISDVIKDQKENKQLQQTADAIINMNPNIGKAFDGDTKKLAQALKKGGLGPYIQLEQLNLQRATNNAQLAQIRQNALYKGQENTRAANADARANEKSLQDRTKFANDLATNWLNTTLQSGNISDARDKILNPNFVNLAEHSTVARDALEIAKTGTESEFKNYLNNLKGTKSETKTIEKMPDGTVVTKTADSTGNTSITRDGSDAGYGTPVSLSTTYKNEPTVLADLQQNQLLNAAPGTTRWDQAQAVVKQAKEREQSAVKFVSDSIGTSPLGTKENLEKLQSTKFIIDNMKSAKEQNNIVLATASITGFIRMFETGVLTDADTERYQNRGYFENLWKKAKAMVGNVDQNLMDEMIQATETVYRNLSPAVRQELENHINSASRQYRIAPARLTEILPFNRVPDLLKDDTSKPQNSGATEEQINQLRD